jgi:oxygen-independent coproporphyrinogen III oxidase
MIFHNVIQVTVYRHRLWHIGSMKTSHDLIRKYNKPGPRYTSYPPVPFWSNTPPEQTWIDHLLAKYKKGQGIDIYVHVPYCESLCYYCGCSRTITKNHNVENLYMDLLLREWELYQEKLGLIPEINSLHFGGGTPTFLSPENLDGLIKSILVNKTENFIGSIEIDPRTCKPDHISVLIENGVKRVSLGIQDFDASVQKIINRHQPVSMVESLVTKMRKAGIHSVNFDLIYGLPGQTKETIKNTIEAVRAMKPDLIAFYSYAHLPGKIKNQRLIPESTLPSPELKRELYELGRALLQEAGYVEVGMDHFALQGSYLYQAKVSDQLHRNFMGYVDKKSSILIGLGPTSISDSSLSFSQNEKDMKDYADRINKGELPIEKGHTHTKTDLLIQKMILDLMCRDKTAFNEDLLPYSADILKEMSEFEKDGIIKRSGQEIQITETGKAFVRNVAMSFDHHLREQTSKVKFSQTI